MSNIASFSAAIAERSGDHNAATAEQALLAAIFKVNGAHSLAMQHCAPGDFLDPFHGRMFVAMGDLLSQGKPINAMTMYFSMCKDPALGVDELRKYFVELNVLPVGYYPSMIVDYAVAIRKYAGQRKLQWMAEDLLKDPESSSVADMAAALASMSESAPGSRAPRHLSDLSISAVEQAETAYKAGGVMMGIPTGLVDLDKLLGGLEKSDLCIIGGRPGMGKTVLGVNIGIHAAKQGNKVGMFSLEMSGEQLAMRFLAGETGVSTDAMRRGSLDALDFEKLSSSTNRSRDIPFFVEDRPALKISEIRAEAEAMKRKHGLDLIIVDYLGLVRPDKQRENRQVDITEVSAGLKAIAKLLEIPVIALAQLNRGLEHREEKRPGLGNLRDSG